MAVLVHLCWTWACSSCSGQGTLFFAAHGLLAVAPLLQSLGSALQLCLRGVVAPQHVGSSRTRDKPKSSAFAGGPSTARPPQKSLRILIYLYCFIFNCRIIALQYCDVSAVQQCESAKSVRMSPPSYACLLPQPPSHPLSHLRVLGRAPCCAKAPH